MTQLHNPQAALGTSPDWSQAHIIDRSVRLNSLEPSLRELNGESKAYISAAAYQIYSIVASRKAIHLQVTEWKWYGNAQTITHVQLPGRHVNIILYCGE